MVSEREQRLAFIRQLGKYRGLLPSQTIHTLKGQALHGDLKGAQAGLKTAANKYMSKQG